MNDCLFCKIIDKQLDSEIVHDDDTCIAFKDINPKARVHLLIVPKKHIAKISDMQEGDEKIVGHLIKIAKDLAEKYECKVISCYSMLVKKQVKLFSTYTCI